ncbi:MAG: glycine--tRNA ligase subunit beta [Acidobacteriia bacterium]|nr:glycine--tRNA ligase subunit beta [Terriglobia bacterium]
MILPFLLEIGTEEIPDWMIPGALESLHMLFEKTGIPHETVRLDATPRRLVLRAEGLPERQADREERLRGPAVKGFTPGPPSNYAPETSTYAQSAIGFARKHGIQPEELTFEVTPKGTYYVVVKKIPGRRTIDLLAESLPGIVLQIYFPKTMYWTTKGGPRFIRPIRWIVALLSDEVVPFEIAGVRSGPLSSGHRRLGSPEVGVTIEDYERRLRDNGVILSAEERRNKIRRELHGVRVKPDDALLETLVYITEYPAAITGAFDPKFLELPEEVLVTVMRHHQKYFSVMDAEGKLAPEFVAVMNIDRDSEGLVRRGNERVLRARFNDARFFWETDQKKKLADRQADLAHVTFLKNLGTYLEKTARVVALTKELGGDAYALRAAELLKCDLTTEVVKEFTELQGIVGGLYARAQGEPELVWQAIYDQYKPESMEDTIPRNHAGRVVALADKLDTLRGCFREGLIPTGSRDPFALRRAAQGVLKILVEGQMDIPLGDFLGDDPALRSFFEERVKFYFKDIRGFRYDEVNAAMAATIGWSNLVDLETRLIRIQNLRTTPDFEPLAASFKRIRNILEQANFASEPRPSGSGIDEELLTEDPERQLYDEYSKIQGHPIEKVISRLRPKVDLFFDKVLVNAPDSRVRQNRLTLLDALLKEFSTIADFSEIVTSS